MSEERGFQLFELLVVTWLLALLAMLGVSRLREQADHYRLKEATGLLVSSLASARGQAVLQGLPIRLEIREDGRALALLPGTEEPDFWRTFPQGVRISARPRRPVIFYSRGSAAPAGTFVLQNPSGQTRVVVAVSGRIRWERLP